MKNKLFSIISAMSGIAFALNLIWENMEAPLYKGYTGFFKHFSICVFASVGDVIIFLVIFCILAFIYHNYLWFLEWSFYRSFLLIIIGAIIGILVERIGIGMWNYTYFMPLLPIVHVGLLPVLQMTLLPITTFYLGGKLIKNYVYSK